MLISQLDIFMKTGFATLILTVGISLLSVAGYAQTPINAVPTTLSAPGKYFLGRDLTFSGSIGDIAINVIADDVTIDLRKFTLMARGATNGLMAIETDRSRLVIENGTIANFRGNAINITFGYGHIVRNVRVVNFGTGGIVFANVNNGLIDGCVVQTNSPPPPGSGSVAIGVFNGSGNRVLNCTVSCLTNAASKYGIWSALGGNDQSNYYENDYIASFIIGISMSPRDEYRTLTTSLCRTGIIGGIDVDNKSE
jgi:hypothetical protein